VLFALENVSCRRAGREVLIDLTAELADGTTALVGPSGAGKSTLLRLLNRLADPDNVSYGPRLCGRECEVDEALALAGLDATFAHRPAQQLSVGEQQRVMLARALALRPAVLLLDEPTAALDDRARDAVERTLLDLRGRLSAALIIVTHDQAQARRLGDRLLHLENGRIADQREPLRA
jgi:putative ABC transport system ATP-binding protein